MRFALAVAVLAVLGGASGGSAQEDVSGSWAMELIDPLGGVNKLALVLEQDGGTLMGQAGGRPLEGTVEGNVILMSYEVPDTQIGPMTLTFEGTIDGAEMEGVVTFGNIGAGGWTATRDD